MDFLLDYVFLKEDSFEYVKKQILNAQELESGKEWVIRSPSDAINANRAISFRHPSSVTIVCTKEQDNNLPKIVHSLFNKTTEMIDVKFYCLDSFYGYCTKEQCEDLRKLIVNHAR